MFDSLAEKLQATLADVRGRGTLTEDDINAAMREIRLALLEADVNFKVVKSFTARGQGAGARRGHRRQAQPRPAGGQDRLRRADRADGRRRTRADVLARGRRRSIVMAGLQGSGKTTADGQARALPARAARLLGGGRGLRRLSPGRGRAADQGRRAGGRRGLRAGHRPRPGRDRRRGRSTARSEGKDVLIVDTSGRLHVDQELMAELASIRKRSSRTTCCSWSTR